MSEINAPRENVQIAAQLWCQPQHANKEMDVAFAESIVVALDAKDKQTEAWKESAAEFCRNMEFYRDIVRRIGEPFGVAARTSDDGSVQESVLALKVPELVAALSLENEKLAEKVKRLEIDYGHTVDRSNAIFAENARLSEQVKEFQEELDFKQKTIWLLHEEKAEDRAANAALREQVKELEISRKVLTAQRDKRDHDLAEQDAEIRERDASIASLRAALVKVNDYNGEQTTRLLKDLDEARERAGRHSAELAHHKEAANDVVDTVSALLAARQNHGNFFPVRGLWPLLQRALIRYASLIERTGGAK